MMLIAFTNTAGGLVVVNPAAVERLTPPADSSNDHTMIHLTSGESITVKGGLRDVMSQLNQMMMKG